MLGVTAEADLVAEDLRVVVRSSGAPEHPQEGQVVQVAQLSLGEAGATTETDGEDT